MELSQIDKNGVALEEQDEERAEKIVEEMKGGHDDPETWPEIGLDPIYCMLLETAILKWDPSYKKYPDKRYVELFKFVIEKLCKYLENVMYFCVKYLNTSSDKLLNKFF